MNETANLERQPHQATRAVVDTLGGAAPRALYRAYDQLNAEHFGGALGAPLLLITPTSSPRALGDYIGRDVHGLRSRVRISPRALERGERFAADIVLHELVHAWQSEIDGDDERGYRGHGPRFAAKCNEIGTKMGLPKVGVKGRGGLPDCAQWPLCVRPDGYYPPTPPKRTAPRRQKHEDAGGEAAASLRTALEEAITIVETLCDEQRRAFEAWLPEAKEALG